VIMDQVLKSLDIRGNIWTRLRQVCAYADDILIMARTKQALADSYKTEWRSTEGRASN
jgi:porphobilinogen deaminase